jgi:hypothetical protein
MAEAACPVQAAKRRLAGFFRQAEMASRGRAQEYGNIAAAMHATKVGIFCGGFSLPPGSIASILPVLAPSRWVPLNNKNELPP